MKPCEEEGLGAAAGGDPWQECMEVAVQLARRAGQVSSSKSLHWYLCTCLGLLPFAGHSLGIACVGAS